MRYLSVCSGIEAATVAWHPLGFSPVAFAEIDRFPAAVLAHHYPSVPNFGDLTKFKEWPDADVSVLVGGTPCQSFSVAGLRAGLADPRGNLALTFLAVLDRYRPAWCCWENVPGVLSADGGRALGSFLGGLGQLGYGFAYRVLDAQYFGLAQRRARVFVVGHLGDWRRAAAVLFERASLSGHPAPRREAGQDVTGTLSSRASAGGGLGTDFDLANGCVRVASTLNAGGNSTGGPRQPGTCADNADSLIIAHSHVNSHANAGVMPSVAFANTAGETDLGYRQEQAPPITGRHGDPGNVLRPGMQVRRLTPRECERLQGFPDDYTLIPYRGKPAADGPRYKALGNSMAVPVMAWIGRRIAMVDALEATA